LAQRRGNGAIIATVRFTEKKVGEPKSDANIRAKEGEIRALQRAIRPPFNIRPRPIISPERVTGYRTLVLYDN
jgi:hypothetical protein